MKHKNKRWIALASTATFLCWPLVVRAQWTAQPNPAQQWTQPKSTNPVQPCCQITNIDTATGIVTGRVNATGKTLRFKVKQQRTLASLKIGLPVSFGKPGSSSPSPDIIDPTSIDEGSQLYINGVYMGEVVGVYGGIYGSGLPVPWVPDPIPGARHQAVPRAGMVRLSSFLRVEAAQTRRISQALLSGRRPCRVASKRTAMR